MGLKVLTVDDSRSIRRIVGKAFKPYDCEVFEAENGVEGLSMAAKQKPDLIILDITMPVMDGAEMLQRLKQEAALKDIPVIMLTAESGQDNVMRIAKLGISDYIVKPFKDVQLIERVEKLFTLAPAQGNGQGASGGSWISTDEEFVQVTFPASADRQMLLELEKQLASQSDKLANSGLAGMICDISSIDRANMQLIKAVIIVKDVCRKSGMQLRVAAAPPIGQELRGFQETADIELYDSVDAARQGGA